MGNMNKFWRAMSRKGRKSTALVAQEREEAMDTGMHRVSSALEALPRFEPAAGFVSRVMARITLPVAVPLHVRLGIAFRQHWVLATTGLAGAAAAGAAALVWQARYPEATPVAVGLFAVRRVGELAWEAVLSMGRLLYESGLMTTLQGIVDSLTTADALMALATVSLVGIGSFSVLLRLVEKPQNMLETSAAR